MTPKNPDFASATEAALLNQPLAEHLGIVLSGIGAGWFETTLKIERIHLQHLGLALAAHTLVAAGQRVVTIEFKINYLRAVAGESVRCRADVVRPGNTVTVSESELWLLNDGKEVLVAKAMGTIAVLSGS